MLGPLLPLISHEYSLTNTVSGALLSAHQVGNLVAVFFAGIVPFYLGRKRALLALSSFVLVGFLMMVLTGNPIWLILGFLFTGISRGSISNFNNLIVNEASGGSTYAFNFLHSIFAVGALLAPFVVIGSTSVLGDAGWRVSVVITMSLIVVAMLLFSRAEITDFTSEQKRAKLTYTFLRERRLWINIGILFFYICAEVIVAGWVVLYFIDSGIMTQQHAQMLASLWWFTMLVGRLTIVIAGNRLNKKMRLIVMSIGTAVFYVFLLSSTGLAMIAIAMGGLGLSMSGMFPTCISNIGKLMQKYPMSLGVLLVISSAGGILMPLVIGVLSDTFGMFAGMSAVVVAILCMLVFVALEVLGKFDEINDAA